MEELKSTRDEFALTDSQSNSLLSFDNEGGSKPHGTEKAVSFHNNLQTAIIKNEIQDDGMIILRMHCILLRCT